MKTNIFTASSCAPALVGLTLLLAGTTPVLAQTVPASVFQSVQARVGERKFSEAVAEALAALETPGATTMDRFRLLRAAAEATGRKGPAGQTESVAIYERIIADAAFTNAQKLEALNGIANALLAAQAGRDLRDMDTAPSRAALARGLELPGLTPLDRAAALTNIAKFWDREYEDERARETYSQITSLDVPQRTKTDAYRQIAESLARAGKREEALTLAREQKLDLVPIYQALGDHQARIAALTPILDDASQPDNVRWAAFNRLPYWDYAHPSNYAAIGNDFTGMTSVGEKYLGAFLEKDPQRASMLLAKFRAATVPSSNVERNRLVSPVFLAWAAPLLRKVPRISPRDYSMACIKGLQARAALGELAQLRTEALEIAADEKADAPTRFVAQLVGHAVLLKEQKQVSEAVAPLIKGSTLPAGEKATAVMDAARMALLAGNETAARALGGAYDTLVPERPRAAIPCRFVPGAPADVSGWLVSPLTKDPATRGQLNRPYGDNLQFLVETDSAVTGREISTSKEPTGDSQTDLFTACDETGVYLFLHAHDARARDVMEGLVSGGSFEMYFAPGEQQPYYTMLPRLPLGDANPTGFLTMYPNEGFRLPTRESGTFNSQIQRTEAGFGIVLFFGWDLFFDKLPTNGERWQFESIRWTRSGGLSFGGSQSVHNRSSWGDIVFAGLDEKAVRGIKRRIVTRAVVKYRNAKKINASVGNWADPQLGDPEFFKTAVEPELQRLDTFAVRVKADMTDSDVDELFAQAVPGWMNVDLNVARSRARYLLDKQMAQ